MLATDIDSEGIAILRLDNEARRNALSIAMRRGNAAARAVGSRRARARRGGHGTGTTFCAGFDLEEFAQPELARRSATAPAGTTAPCGGFGKPRSRRSTAPRSGAGSISFAVRHAHRYAPRRGSPTPRSSSARRPCSRRCSGSSAPASLEICADRQAHRHGRSAPARTGQRRSRTLLAEADATARLIAEAPGPALDATKRYLVTSAGVTFDESFAVEHDDVFDEFLLGAFGPGPASNGPRKGD